MTSSPVLLIDVIHADFTFEHGLHLIFEREGSSGTEVVHVCLGLVLQVAI